MEVGRTRPNNVSTLLGNSIRNADPFLSVQPGNPQPRPLQRWARVKRSKIFFYKTPGFVSFEISGNDQAAIIGSVVSVEKFLHILRGSHIQMLLRSNDQPGIGMSLGKEIFKNHLEGPSIGNILVTLTAFVLNHISLVVQFLLGQDIREITHPVSFEPSHIRQRLSRYRPKID